MATSTSVISSFKAGVSFCVLVWCCSTSTSAQLDSNIAVLVRSPVATSTQPTTITVYRNDAGRSVMFDKAVLITLGRLVDHRLQFRDNNPAVPDEAVSDTSSEPATLTLPVTMTTAEKTGVYTVTVSDGEGSTELRVLVTNENALVNAAEYSTVVSQGDSVTLRAVRGGSVTDMSLRWQRDGSFISMEGGKAFFLIITAQNSEVFECFTAGRYSMNIHAIMNLIVRGCPESKTGPGCQEECPRCFNGGVCSDETVSCLCPSGFSGDYCENVHGRNVFGQNAEYKCDDTTDDHGDGCQGAIICYPEPFGCICPAGYTGLDCMQECEDGKFGANCKQNCHCQDGISCTRDTGKCENNQCAVGWKGINCQVEDPCQVGVFGDLCNLPCACPSGDCSGVQSNCARGCAMPWTGVACDEDSGIGVITNLIGVKVNPGVATTVSCSAIRNPVLGENDLRLMAGSEVVSSPNSSISGIGEKRYTRNNTWMVTLPSESVITATCSIIGTSMSQSRQLIPYGLGQNTVSLHNYEMNFQILHVSWKAMTIGISTWTTWDENVLYINRLLQYSANRGPLLNFSMITSTSMFVQWPMWEPVRDDVGDGPVEDYVIEYREEGGNFTEAVRTLHLSYQFTDLKVDTLYEFRIVLAREGPYGDGPPSVSQTQRTLCGVPTMSPTLMFESITTRTTSFKVEIPPMDQWSCSRITASFQRQESIGQWIEVQSLSPLSVTVDVSDLIPCTSYTFRVQIINTDSSAESQPVDVTTQPEALVLSDLTVSSTTAMGQLDVSWSLSDTPQTNCVLSMYTVIYRLVRHVACTSDVIESTNVTRTTTSTSLTLSDLNDYAEYEVRVRADGEVEGIEVNEVGRTLTAALSAAPMNISLTNISSTCLEFTWEPPPCDQHNGDILDYQYSLYFTNGTTNDTVISTSSMEETGVLLCGLIPYFEYYFNVRASTLAGQGPDSEIVTERTEEDVPPQIDPPRFPFTNASSLQLRWQTPNPPHGVITGYDISFRRSNDSQSNISYVSVDAEIDGEPPSYILRDLEPFTNYSIRVRANTRIGPGEWSLPIISKTKEGFSSSPRNLTVADKSKTWITIEWDIPEKPRGDIIEYEICYQAMERPYHPDYTVAPCKPQTLNNSMDTHIIHNITLLEPSTVYHIEVSAYTSAGQGDISNITARTDIENDFIPVPVGDITPPTRDRTSATISLPPLTDMYATHYFIRVKDPPITKRSVGGIGSYEENPTDYITAEIEKGDEKETFTIGDGQIYGIYRNAPLEQGKEYDIYIGTGSRVGQDTEVVWSEPLPLPVPVPENKFPWIYIVIAVVGLAVLVVLIIGIIRIRRRGQKQTDNLNEAKPKDSSSGIPYLISTAKPKYSSSGIPLKQKTHKLEVEAESGHYEETGPKPSGKAGEYGEHINLELSASVILDSLTTDHQLERESQFYMEPSPVLKNKRGTNGETGGSDLYYNDDGYDETDVDIHSDNVKIRLPDESKKRVILPATPQMHAVDSLYTRNSETYEELPGLDISQAKMDVSCSIKIKDLPDLLQNKDMDPEDTVRDEFPKLPQRKQHPWTVGALRDKKPSSGILPYDHSRVKLEKNSSVSKFDYYNAKFIKDQHNENSLIAAQGPTTTTLDTFWTMIWDQNIELIVNLSELTGTACQYWPSGIETIKKYGDLTVIWFDNLMDCCDFSIRELKVIKGDKVHEVKLCHFLSWPETSFPHQPAALLDFIKKVKALRNKQSLPLLIHCSNGVGATGTFIAIYSLLEGLRNKKKNRTDVLEFVTNMRKNRVDMVQNENQYTFVYETLATALLTPETVMSAESLLEMNLDLQKDSLVKEYEVLTALSKVMTPRNSLVGQRQENANKNRPPKVIPLDSCRAVLKSSGCFEGSNDYINASLLNSTGLKDGFIMTQAPLGGTVEDLWRMIYDYECAAIVSLNEMDENDEEVYIYWPEGGKVQYGNMSVKCADVTTHKDAYIERHLLVKHRKSQKEVSVHHYQLSTWPQHKNQSGALLEIIFKVQPLMKSKQRIAVHCLDGVKRSGVLVAVAAEMFRLKTCKEVDLFQTVHKLRGKNPHVVTEMEDYLLCYQLLKSSLEAEESAYANIGE